MKRGKKGQPLPAGYVELVKRLCVLIEEWCSTQPGLPDLRWLDPGDTVFVGALRGPALDYLVDSPDARRLCGWLDEKTNHEATLFQMTMALRFLGHLPGRELRASTPADRESPALQQLVSFVRHTGTDTRHESKPCPHCGKGLDATSGMSGHVPRVGDLSICIYCCGFMQFGEDLLLLPLSEADIDALAVDNAEQIAKLREMRDLFRASRMPLKSGVQA